MKKNIIKTLIVLVLLTLVITLFKVYKKNVNQKIVAEIEPIYKEIHNLYQYGEGIRYNAFEGERIHLELEDGIYYEMTNYNDAIEKYFSNNFINHVNEYLNIKYIDGKYYIKDLGRVTGNYLKTTFKVKKANKKKRILVASSKFCEAKYGNMCDDENTYTIDKELVLINDNGTWKIDSYISVFEMSDEIR